MNKVISTIRNNTHNYMISVLVLWVIYAALTFFAPSGDALGRYNISLAQLSLVRITFLLPFLIIWLTLAYAVVRFQSYTQLLGSAPEREGFRNLTHGLYFLLLVTLIPSFIRMIAVYRPDDFAIEKNIAILSQYVTLALYLTAFYFFWNASRSLVATLKPSELSIMRGSVLGITFILGVAYLWAIMNNATRTVSNDPLVKPTYYLTDPYIITTIALPYIAMWVLGFLAIVNFSTYSKLVDGVIYKRSFQYVSIGISAIIGLLIILQFLTQLGTYFGHSSLQTILVIIYIILFALAFGYIYLARGAKELTAIENA